MPDVEKVIHDLEKCLDDSVAAVVPADTVREVIALLKAREPVEPKKLMSKIKNGYKWRFYCGKCGDEIDRLDKYCRHCGREVKF